MSIKFLARFLLAVIKSGFKKVLGFRAGGGGGFNLDWKGEMGSKSWECAFRRYKGFFVCEGCDF